MQKVNLSARVRHFELFTMAKRRKDLKTTKKILKVGHLSKHLLLPGKNNFYVLLQHKKLELSYLNVRPNASAVVFP